MGVFLMLWLYTKTDVALKENLSKNKLRVEKQQLMCAYFFQQ